MPPLRTRDAGSCASPVIMNMTVVISGYTFIIVNMGIAVRNRLAGYSTHTVDMPVDIRSERVIRVHMMIMIKHCIPLIFALI